MKDKHLKYFFLTMLLMVLFSCKKEGEYHSVTDKIKAEQKPYHGKLTSEDLLTGTDLIKITEGEFTFLIPKRKGQIKSYECIECHSKPFEKKKNANLKKAHWNIALKHANSDIMNCATCHNENDMNSLKSLTNQKIDINLSYKLCSQCHSSQFNDWKGGAHGKKVAGWTPPRASKTCVNCHNPHSPSFEKRWPVQFNTQKGIERNDGLGH